MPEGDVLQLTAGGGGDDLAFQVQLLEAGVNQLMSNDDLLSKAMLTLQLNQGVVVLGMQIKRLVGRNGPRSGGPDDDCTIGYLIGIECPGQRRFVSKGKGDKDGRIASIGILYLSLCQRRATIKTPIHRLEPAKNKTLFQNTGQNPHLIGLVAEIHGAVRIIPLAQYAQADEILFLFFYLLFGVSTGFFLHFVDGQVFAKFSFYLVFTVYALSFPIRDVLGIKPCHIAAFDDNVFEEFIHCVDNVYVSFRLCLTFVQYEFWAKIG